MEKDLVLNITGDTKKIVEQINGLQNSEVTIKLDGDFGDLMKDIQSSAKTLSTSFSKAFDGIDLSVLNKVNNQMKAIEKTSASIKAEQLKLASINKQIATEEKKYGADTSKAALANAKNSWKNATKDGYKITSKNVQEMQDYVKWYEKAQSLGGNPPKTFQDGGERFNYAEEYETATKALQKFYTAQKMAPPAGNLIQQKEAIESNIAALKEELDTFKQVQNQNKNLASSNISIDPLKIEVDFSALDVLQSKISTINESIANIQPIKIQEQKVDGNKGTGKAKNADKSISSNLMLTKEQDLRDYTQGLLGNKTIESYSMTAMAKGIVQVTALAKNGEGILQSYKIKLNEVDGILQSKGDLKIGNATASEVKRAEDLRKTITKMKEESVSFNSAQDLTSRAQTVSDYLQGNGFDNFKVDALENGLIRISDAANKVTYEFRDMNKEISSVNLSEAAKKASITQNPKLKENHTVNLNSINEEISKQEKLDKLYDNSIKHEKSYMDLKSKYNTGNNSENNKLDLESSYKKRLQYAKEIESLNQDGFTNNQKALELEQKKSALQKDYAQTMMKSTARIEKPVNDSSYKRLYDGIEKYQGKQINTSNIINTNGLNEALSTITKVKEEMNKLSDNGKFTGSSKQFDDLNNSAKEAFQTIDKLTKAENQLVNKKGKLLEGFELGSTNDLAKLKQQMVEVAKATANGKVKIKEFNDTTKELKYTVTDNNNQVKQMKLVPDMDNNGFRQAVGTVKEQAGLVSGMLDGIGTKFRSLFQYAVSSIGIYQVWGMFKQGIGVVKDFDTALTDLKKTSNGTAQDYSGFVQEVQKSAPKVGSTSQILTESAADWSRLGYTLEESATMAKNTAILMNVSEFENVSDATNSLISIMQAFHINADESMGLIDKLNNVGKIIAQVA